MKLGWNLKAGSKTKMTSWASDDDPSEGQYTFWMDSPETPQLVLSSGVAKLYRWGPWDGVKFSGGRELKPNTVFTPSFYSSAEEVFYSFKGNNDSTLWRSVVTPLGLVQYLVWSESENDWKNQVTIQGDTCDNYGYCDPYGVCYEAPVCKCLEGFQQKTQEEGSILLLSGCERKWNLSCENGDGFIKYGALKLPDKSYLPRKRGLGNLKECESECLKSCTCTAYAWLHIPKSRGNCLLWSGDLIDMKNLQVEGSDLYIRMSRQELKVIGDSKKRKELKLAILIASTSLVFVVISVCFLGKYLSRKKLKKWIEVATHSVHQDEGQETQKEHLELPFFTLADIFAATSELSFANKIGEGGFGPVYKGVLPSGQEVAVKRLLSPNCGQGMSEFKNEVLLIQKLLHRNLVKLLGCCIEGEERMLVYEYLHNGSLNYFLFDPERKKLLSWKTRFDIIMGTARGLLYLHQDARLRIIHRDLKASNVLLDINMNPKISDFGTARIFGEERTSEKTKRVIGTYGYMSPEYAMSGFFSVKSDVFSFGVLVLEIISGKRNWGFYHPDHDLNLLGHAWKLWNESRPLELMDKKMGAEFSVSEVTRCIKVGLLCVQQRVEDRPTMSTVLFILGNNESCAVPEPKEPCFVSEGPLTGADASSSGENGNSSRNNLSITVLDGR